MSIEYDVIIIGGGPAGLTAAIYCARSRLRTLLLERAVVGGQLLAVDTIENYPGFSEGLSAFELIEQMKKQAQRFGTEFAEGEASEIKLKIKNEKLKISIPMLQVNTKSKEQYYTKAAIIATGANPKKLGIKGEIELRGKGVSYCATCDGPLFKDKEIVVIGGGDTAVGEAIYLARFAKKISLVHRRDGLRAAKILQERLLGDKKVEIKWNSVATEILGGQKVCGVRIADVKTNKKTEVPASGVFIFVGLEPNTEFLKGAVELDKDGFIITDEDMRTSVNGLFACGDVRKNALKQIVTSCGEGALAAHFSYCYIEGLTAKGAGKPN